MLFLKSSKARIIAKDMRFRLVEDDTTYRVDNPKASLEDIEKMVQYYFMKKTDRRDNAKKLLLKAVEGTKLFQENKSEYMRYLEILNQNVRIGLGMPYSVYHRGLEQELRRGSGIYTARRPKYIR